MLASKWAGKEGNLHSPLLIGLLISLLEALLISLLISLLEVLVSQKRLLRVGYILLHISKTLIASTYHIWVGLKSTICIGLILVVTIFVL